MMKRETKIIIAIAILGIVLFIVSVGKSPMWNQILIAMFSISQYLITNAGEIITSPVCYGSIGLLLMLFASRYFSNSERQQRREAKQEARRQRQEAIEQRRQERIGKSSLLKAFKEKVVSLQKRKPQHRPPIDDNEAIRLIEGGLSYRQAYDKLYPPEQDTKKEQEREKIFNTKWRSRVSKKVNERIKNLTKDNFNM